MVTDFLTGPSGFLEHAVIPLLLVVVASIMLVLRSTAGEWRAALLAVSIGLAAITVPLVLAVVGPDYFYFRNVLPGLVPLLAGVAVALSLRAARRAGLAVASALVASFGALVILVATNVNHQRPDWRSAAEAIAPMPEPALVFAPRTGDQPLSFYLNAPPAPSNRSPRVVAIQAVNRNAHAFVSGLPKQFRPQAELRLGQVMVRNYESRRPRPVSESVLREWSSTPGRGLVLLRR